MISGSFLISVKIERPESQARYAVSIPALSRLDSLTLHPKVTFFVGENGSGKSTLLEAIAIAAGCNPEGGSRNFRFESKASHSDLNLHMRLIRGTNGQKIISFSEQRVFSIWLPKLSC